MPMVHEYLKLHVTNEAFYIENADQGGTDMLCIDRVTGDIELKSNSEQIPPTVMASKVAKSLLKYVSECLITDNRIPAVSVDLWNFRGHQACIRTSSDCCVRALACRGVAGTYRLESNCNGSATLQEDYNAPQ